jgi:uncharacterized protein with von Willebrand factor type A (vWA) domain
MERIARQRRDQLDRMPDDLGSRVKELRNYEFMDEAARERFEDLLKKLQQQIVDQMFQGMKQSIEGMKGQDLSRIREMVRDLNQMLEQRQQGLTPNFQEFKQKYGDMFPPEIDSLDQLLEHLQRQMAQMQSLLQSLSPEARDELRRLRDALAGVARAGVGAAVEGSGAVVTEVPRIRCSSAYDGTAVTGGSFAPAVVNTSSMTSPPNRRWPIRPGRWDPS